MSHLKLSITSRNTTIKENSWDLEVSVHIDNQNPEKNSVVGVFIDGRRIGYDTCDDWGNGIVLIEDLPFPQPFSKEFELEAQIKGTGARSEIKSLCLTTVFTEIKQQYLFGESVYLQGNYSDTGVFEGKAYLESNNRLFASGKFKTKPQFEIIEGLYYHSSVSKEGGVTITSNYIYEGTFLNGRFYNGVCKFQNGKIFDVYKDGESREKSITQVYERSVKGNKEFQSKYGFMELLNSKSRDRKWFSHVVTDFTIFSLREKRVPKKILNKLLPIKDKPFIGADSLKRELNKQLGWMKSRKYSDLITSCSKFNRIEYDRMVSGNIHDLVSALNFNKRYFQVSQTSDKTEVEYTPEPPTP